MCHRYKHSHLLRRPPKVKLMAGEEIPNAIIAMGMVITLGNVHQHHEHHRDAEDRCVVDGVLEDVEVDGEEEDEGDVQVSRCQPIPRWCR